MENLYTENCIRTYTGKYLDVFNPTEEMICIEDIAHALANKCRFAGQTGTFYSVAQHSVNVSRRVPEPYRLEALLHDAAEAYLEDIASPIKKRLPDYKALENSLLLFIADMFGFGYPLSSYVKQADKLEFEDEWDNYVLNNDAINCYSPEKAERIFLKEFKDLTK